MEDAIAEIAVALRVGRWPAWGIQRAEVLILGAHARRAEEYLNGLPRFSGDGRASVEVSIDSDDGDFYEVCVCAHDDPLFSISVDVDEDVVEALRAYVSRPNAFERVLE